MTIEEQNTKLKEAAWKLVKAIDNEGFFLDGYRNGSASTSEASQAMQERGQAKSEMWNLLKSLES